MVNEIKFENSLFPKIPSRVSGQDTLLIGTDGIPCLADDYLTTRDIRKGNYNKMIRVSAYLFMLNIALKAISKNAPHQFDVYMAKSTHHDIVYYPHILLGFSTPAWISIKTGSTSLLPAVECSLFFIVSNIIETIYIFLRSDRIVNIKTAKLELNRQPPVFSNLLRFIPIITPT